MVNLYCNLFWLLVFPKKDEEPKKVKAFFWLLETEGLRHLPSPSKLFVRFAPWPGWLAGARGREAAAGEGEGADEFWWCFLYVFYGSFPSVFICFNGSFPFVFVFFIVYGSVFACLRIRLIEFWCSFVCYSRFW